MFFLQADPVNGFYRHVSYGSPIAPGNLNVEAQTKLVRALVKVYSDPQKALLAEKARDRQFAAIALVGRHRASRPHLELNAHVREAIPEDQSRLILSALA